MGASASVSSFEAEGFAEAFRKLDVDGSGKIDRSEFFSAALSLGITDEDVLNDIFFEIDKNRTGDITTDEFVRYCVASVRKRSLKNSTPGLILLS